MSINIAERQLPHQYEGYKVNIDRPDKEWQQREKESTASNDTVDITEDSRKALEDKLFAFSRSGIGADIRKLSAVNSYSVMNAFESAVSAEKKAGVKCNTFDRHIDQMVSAYNRMKNDIEEKYADTDREQQYYVADDGSIQELTKEKELELLDKAYAKHSEFMAASTEIWSELQEFRPQITSLPNKGVKRQTVSTENTKKGKIKNQAYQAFLSAIDSENIRLLSQKKEGLQPNSGISTSARNNLNRIWDYYANLR